MSAPAAITWRDPPAQLKRASTLATAFGLWAGPLAWFIQVCAGAALASWPCYPLDSPRLTPPSGYGWTWGTVIGISLAAVVISLLALFVSRAIYERTGAKRPSDQGEVATADERACFMALWGMLLSAGSVAVTAFTTVVLFLLPRCAV